MLCEDTLFGKVDKVQQAIDLIRTYEPDTGYYVGISGGKDSTVIYKLIKLAGVKAEFHFNVTTVDPPEIIKFIRQNFSDVIFDYPNESMFKLIIRYGFPPTRHIRYCCSKLKEVKGRGRITVFGIRSQESNKRSNRKIIEFCYKQHKHIFLPILHWTEDDVWEFHDVFNLPHVELYDRGYTRVGCILCPLATTKVKLQHINDYPRFASAFIKTFDKMLANRDRSKIKDDCWKNGEEVFYNWIHTEHTNPIREESEQDEFFIDEG